MLNELNYWYIFKKLAMEDFETFKQLVADHDLDDTAQPLDEYARILWETYEFLDKQNKLIQANYHTWFENFYNTE